MLDGWKCAPIYTPCDWAIIYSIPGVLRQLESSFATVPHLTLSNHMQAGGTCTYINCSPINMSPKSLIYLLEAS